MSERTLFCSPLALRDLDDIFDYIANELRNPVSAAETVNAILDGTEQLEDFPFIGSIVDGLPFMTDEYRFIGIRNDLVFYRITDTRIFIDRILYNRRDYLPLLGLQ
ncbi:MAG: type II toxin-antitoxin system RelE/ParE family toxin [Kiritimatiellae bacterium]|nr:type II toxin-antitoxin system RelE/ParE family toxin [Kiritimatiellia bacterium]